MELFSELLSSITGITITGFLIQLNYEIKHFAYYSISLIGYYYIKALLYII